MFILIERFYPTEFAICVVIGFAQQVIGHITENPLALQTARHRQSELLTLHRRLHLCQIVICPTVCLQRLPNGCLTNGSDGDSHQFTDGNPIFGKQPGQADHLNNIINRVVRLAVVQCQLAARAEPLGQRFRRSLVHEIHFHAEIEI